MEGKGIYTILLAIVAVLAIALTVLIILLFSVWNPKTGEGTNTPSASPETVIQSRVVPYDESATFVIYSFEEPMNLKPEVEKPESIILVNVTIKCDLGKKSKNEELVNSLIENYRSDLKQSVSQYFTSMTFAEAGLIETQYKASDDLKKVFNEILNTGMEEKQEFVYKVNFDKWFIQ